MKQKKFWAVTSRLLAAATVMLVVMFALAAAAAAPACHKYKVLYRFAGGTDGNNPFAGLIFDAAGNLYGTTPGGGTGSCQYDPPGCGTVFQLAPNQDGSWTKTILHNFTGYPDDGAYPLGRLIFDEAGNLYGTAAYDGTDSCRCGAVFKLSPNPDGSWTESVLYSFTGGPDGTMPDANLIFDTAGSLYSTTFVGGIDACDLPWGPGCGLLFKLTPGLDGNWSESARHRFKGGMDGANPWHAGLTWDAAGDLFGTTSYGGAYDAGTVFKLTPNDDGSWTKRRLHHFTGGKDGATPRGNVILDALGNLYGTTSAGGAYGNGTVYKLTPGPNDKWAYRVIHQFTGGKDGANPYANQLVLDSAGNLYGMTYQGGAYGKGVAFRLVPNQDGTWKGNLLHTFTGGDDGESPYGSGLILDGAGNLYGTAFGPYDCQSQQQCGVVFEITP